MVEKMVNEVKRNECYYKKSTADGVKASEETIWSAGDTPEKTWELFMKIKNEMVEKK